MFRRILVVLPIAVVLSAMASPIAAQYKTHFDVTGGPLGGTYEFVGTYGATPSMCALTRDSTGSNVITTTNEMKTGPRSRVASASITFGGSVNADFTTTSFRFAIRFNGTDAAPPSMIQFDGTGATRPADAGTLSFAYYSFIFAFSGTTVVGTEPVRVSGTIACKAYNHF